MKTLKPAAIRLNAPVVIFFGALIITSCQPSTDQAQSPPTVTPSVSPSPLPSPKVIEPSVKAEVKPSPVETQLTQTEATPTPMPEETIAPVQEKSGYVAGTCKELKAQGLSDFRPGDANYTAKRDRDNDGVACES
ncbi:excalibur calcium-binding domain-containing protein [Phormidesmis sp. 146-33]